MCQSNAIRASVQKKCKTPTSKGIIFFSESNTGKTPNLTDNEYNEHNEIPRIKVEYVVIKLHIMVFEWGKVKS